MTPMAVSPKQAVTLRAVDEGEHLPCRVKPWRNVSCSCSDQDLGAFFSLLLSPAGGA